MAEVTARKRIWGWMMFDWATQPFYTLLLTFIFGPYLVGVVADLFVANGQEAESAKAQAQTYWSNGQVFIGLIIAATAPVLGAFADTTGRRMPWMYGFSVLYVVSTFALWWMVPDGSAILLCFIAFGVAMVTVEYMQVFINAMLPSLGRDDEIGAISGSGFALGYAGGVIALFIMLLFFAESGDGKTFVGFDPAFGLSAETREGTRSVGPITAIWFLVFIAPFFLWVKDTRSTEPTGTFRDSLSDLWASLSAVLKIPSLFAYLTSSMFYRDALNAIYIYGGVYALLVLDWDITTRGIFGIIAAISAGIFSWLGGRADRVFGPKPVILANVWVLIVVVTVIVSMSREALFGIQLAEGSKLPDYLMFTLGAVIGGAGGALQSASRTMMARHTDPDRPTEAFGLYAFSGKATAFLAPGLIGFFTYLTDSPRYGLFPIIFLFIIALILLRWVNPEGNREHA